MTEKLRNQKDTLAKLMSQEDITVVHKKIPTAYFDVKNRILACPIFKDDISPELYDLFMGHEVGHALNTPYEGLHSTLQENRTLKGYLNVVEDVRIESAIKNKFQGLRKSFYTAYNELMEMDFFGIKKRDLQTLSLIDKINLITKVGSRVNINLTDEEQVLLDKCYACKTWEDVVEVATEIYEWSKENETRDETDEKLVQTLPDVGEDDEDDYDEDFDDMSMDSESSEGEDEDDEEEVGTSSNAGDSLPDLEDEEESESEEGDEEGEESDEEIKETGVNTDDRTGGEGFNDDPDGARESITEHAAHNNEDQFLSDENKIRTQKDLKEIYDNLDMTKSIVTYKQVKEDWTKYFSNKDAYEREYVQPMAELTAKKLVDKSKSVVAHMAKEFDMRQTAQRSVHAFTGKTGKLDMNSIAKYQIVDDIFKRAVYLPDGKNHGVTVLLDWSGSIANELRDLIEQSIILAEFCRKVQIPYRVYAFTDSYYEKDEEGNLFRGEARLIEFLSNEMSNRDHKFALTVLASVWNEYFTRNFSWRNFEKNVEEYNEWFGSVKTHNGGYLDMPRSVPNSYGLGGTPLDQCLGYLRVLLPAFNKQYGIEKSILTVITDGFSHQGDIFRKTQSEMDDWSNQYDSMGDSESYYRVKQDREIIDPFNRKVYPLMLGGDRYDNGGFSQTQNILEWIADTTGVTVTGYFVCSKKQDAMSVLQHATGDYWGHDESWKEIRKTGKVYSVRGYNKLFLTGANVLAVSGSDELDDEFIDAKKTRIMAAFKRNQKSKTTSRFLTTEFIKEIA